MTEDERALLLECSTEEIEMKTVEEKYNHLMSLLKFTIARTLGEKDAKNRAKEIELMVEDHFGIRFDPGKKLIK